MGALKINNCLSPADKLEKRYFPRWKVKKHVICSLRKASEHVKATTLDLSCTGACLKTYHPIPFKTKIQTTIYLSKSKSIQIRGEIIWHKPLKVGHLYGIQFGKMDASSENLLFSHAFNVNFQNQLHAEKT